MKSLSIILTLIVCAFLAVGMLVAMFGTVADVLVEEPAVSEIAPTPARPNVGPRTEYTPYKNGKE